MNLRKTIKLRTFYDDQDYRDPHQDQVYRAPPKPVKKPAYQGQVVKFNPDLRPAVFPTIPLNQEIKESEKEIGTHVSSESSLASLPRAQPPAPTNAPTWPSQPTLQANSRTLPQSQNSASAFDISDMFASIDQTIWSRRPTMSPGSSPSPDRRVGSCDLENPVYARNMELIEKLSKRTDEELVEAEMATSDEDEEDESRGRQMVDRARPAWDNLPLALQLDLVDTVGETQTTLDDAFRALRLKPQQKLATLDHLRLRNQHLDDEEQIITEVREETDRVLLTGNKRKLDHFLKSGYRRFIKKYLYAAASRNDYLTASGRDLSLAKAYLNTCGITLNLNHWTNVSRCDDIDAAGIVDLAEPLETSMPAPLSIQPGGEAAMKPHLSACVLPAAPALSIPPGQEVVKKPSLTASDPLTANPPVAEVAKPKRLLKVPPKRHHSTHTQAKPNPSSIQGNVEFARRPGPHQATKSPKETRPVQAPPKEEPPKPPDREAYIPPPLALPFTLPPQLSSHRQEWLPDGRPLSPTAEVSASQPAAMVPNMVNRAPRTTSDRHMVADRRASTSGIAPIPKRPVNSGLPQNPYRQDHAVQTQYDYNGNVLNTTPVAREDYQDQVHAYEHLQQQIADKGDPPPPPSLRDPRLVNNRLPMAPPPMSTNLRSKSSRLTAPPPLRSTTATTYSTDDFGTPADASSTAQKPWQPVASQPAGPASIDPVPKKQQRRTGFVDVSDPAPAIATGSTVVVNGTRAGAEQGKDDDYTPAKARKAPARAAKRRKTTGY